MNKVILIGRLTKDPDVRYSSGSDAMCVARYTLAVDRRGRKTEGAPTADFISVVAFRANGEFAEKYLRKGTKILVEGRIQTSNYTNKDGEKVYRTEVVADNHEFVESKSGSGSAAIAESAPTSGDTSEFIVPDGIEEELPFN